MRRTLVVMRHAKSSWDTGLPDFERPLSRRGAKDAAAAGRILAGYRLGCVLSSTSTRTRQTWAGATNGGAACLDVRFTDALYHAWTDEVLVEMGSIPDEVGVAMILGHAPTMESVVTWLAAPSELVEQVKAHFPTTAMAVLEFEGHWDALERGEATLTRYEIPRG